MRSASRPCSPVHHHEGHAKLAGSPPRASPVRMGPSYVLKKGSQELAPREGGGAGLPGGARGRGWKSGSWPPFSGTCSPGLCGTLLMQPLNPPHSAGTQVGAHLTDSA